jgi:guanylate kinase
MTEQIQKSKPVLQKKAEFEAVLQSYRPSDEAIKVLRSTRTLFMIGTTASGRNTLINELLKTGMYYSILSNTTRPRRMIGDRLEYDGESYWHITEDQFLEGLRDGRYIEAAIIHGQQVSGSNISEYEKARDAGKVTLKDIEGLYGPPVIHGYSPEAMFVFILPPAFEEWIERLRRRGAMSAEELRTRLLTSIEEIKAALERDYYQIIVSGDLSENTEAVHAFVRDGKPINLSWQRARDHAEQLLIEIALYLQSM